MTVTDVGWGSAGIAFAWPGLAFVIVGILLVSAMMVVPVACSLQNAKSFAGTIMGGMAYGLLSVFVGLLLSYYANLAPGGAIVLVGSVCFIINFLWKLQHK